MTVPEILDLVRPIWAEDLRRRQQQHDHQIRLVAAQCAARGIGHSGAHIQMGLDACVAEARTRAHLARRVLCKAIAQTDTRWTARDLRAIYLEVIVNMNRDIDAAFQGVLHSVGPVGATTDTLALSLAHEEVAAIEKEIAELALFAATPKPTVLPPDGRVVVHGSVYGAVQTGDGSKADVVVNIDSASAAALCDAVQALRSSLRASPPPDLPTYADAVFADLEDEVSKAQPQPKRIAALLGTAASIVETLANAPGAWESVKHAAGAIGIGLP